MVQLRRKNRQDVATANDMTRKFANDGRSMKTIVHRWGMCLPISEFSEPVPANHASAPRLPRSTTCRSDRLCHVCTVSAFVETAVVPRAATPRSPRMMSVTSSSTEARCGHPPAPCRRSRNDRTPHVGVVFFARGKETAGWRDRAPVTTRPITPGVVRSSSTQSVVVCSISAMAVPAPRRVATVRGFKDEMA
jgi:hypothetical protein